MGQPGFGIRLFIFAERAWSRIAICMLVSFIAGILLLMLIVAVVWYRCVSWECPPYQVDSPSKIGHEAGQSFQLRGMSVWQQGEPLYYRYKVGYQQYTVVIAGKASGEAIEAFRTQHETDDLQASDEANVEEALSAFSGVSGFEFKRSSSNLSFVWREPKRVVGVFDRHSGWLVLWFIKSM